MATRPASAPAPAPAPGQPGAPADGSPLMRYVIRPLVRLHMYVKGPMVLYRTPPRPTGHTVVPFDAAADAALRPPAREFLDRGEAALADLGFAAPVRGVLTAATNVTTYFSLLEHPEHGALATLAALQTGGKPHVPPKVVPLIFYRTEFDDGRAMVTTNASTKRRFPRRPDVDHARFPAVRDPKSLYRVHRFRVGERAATVPVRRATRGADPLAYQQRESEQDQERWVTIGYYRRTPDGALAVTRRGATLLAWRGMFPWAQIVDRRDENRAAEILRRWRAAGSP